MATPTTLPATFVAGNVLTAAQMNDLRGAFRVLQVVSTTKTDAFSTTSGTLVDVTGLSATITPSATSSLVLVVVTMGVGSQQGSNAHQVLLLRGSTPISRGDAAGSRSRLSAQEATADSGGVSQVAITILDNPATTSATTYKLQVCSNVAGQTVGVNRSKVDTDSVALPRTASTITLMEISA